MIILYAFAAFLSFSLFQASRNVAEEDGDIPLLYSGNKLVQLSAWFLLTGLLLPVIMLFVNEKWYFAILYSIAGIVISMLLANHFTYNMHVVKRPPFYIPSRVDARPCLVTSLVSVIILLLILLR